MHGSAWYLARLCSAAWEGLSNPHPNRAPLALGAFHSTLVHLTIPAQVSQLSRVRHGLGSSLVQDAAVQQALQCLRDPGSTQAAQARASRLVQAGVHILSGVGWWDPLAGSPC